MTRLINLAGQRFGKLVVLRREGTVRHGAGTCPTWLCRCDCGRESVVRGPALRHGITRSCGCLQWRHGEYQKDKPSVEYSTWRGMIDRCTNPRAPHYAGYGGRGIRVCERWRHDFNAFLADMGKRPADKTSIDRINVNGNYEPGNCRWATVVEQHRNKRNNHRLTFRGETMPLSAWAERVGLGKTTIRERLNRGWSVDKALTTPPLQGSWRKGMRSARRAA